MPKGVYDRSKAKAKKSEKSEKAETVEAAAPVAKRKYTKRADKAASPVLQGAAPQVAVVRDAYADIQLLGALTSTLSSLKGTSLESTIMTKIGAVVERLEPAPVVQQAEEKPVVAEKTEVKAEVAVASMPFPAPIPFNGANPQS